MVHTTANSCNYGIKEFSILSDSFTAGFAFVNSYCQNIVLADESAINFEFVCNYTGNYTYVGVIATYGEDGMLNWNLCITTNQKNHDR